jgi:NADH-quinone oxidoreductase subunit L
MHLLLFILPLLTAGITTFYMFRMWFMTFTGKPRDHHVYDHAHESPRTMTTPLIILAFFSIVVAWGWPIWDAEESYLEHHLHRSQHAAIAADFGRPFVEGEAFAATVNPSAHEYAHDYHHLAGNLALAVVIIAIVFAYLIYYRGVLDPAEAKEQFPAVHRFLWHKWYFDELYSAVLVRPALVVANWCRAFDTHVIDRFVDTLGQFTVNFSAWNGKFDLGIIDGLVNLVANVFFGIGARLRNVQTGFLRSYVLFLVIAAVAIFAILSYFVTMATAN